MKTKFTLLATAVAAVSIGSAQAALLTYEGFDYTSAANITGQTGGTGWRTPTNPAWNSGTGGTVAASELGYTGINASYTAFSPTGNAANMGGVFRNDRFFAIDTGAAYATAGLRGAGNFIGGSTVTGTLWGSFLVNASQWGTGSGPQMLFNMSSGVGTGTQASIRQTGAGSAIGVTDTGGGGIGATGSILTSALSITNPNLIVFRYEFNGASNDTFSVWLNPTAASDSASITATDYILNNLEIRSVNANGALAFDEIRFGTTFADVVPIPERSTLALLAGGVGALTLIRRRRQS